MTEKDLDIAIEKCERIMEMDTRTMQNPVSENGYIFEKVYDLLKFLRQLQFETGTKSSTNDTISRQAAIDAENIEEFKKNLSRTINTGIVATNTKDVYSCGMRNGMRWCRYLIDDEPPKFEKAREWIPCSERLPEPFKLVLIQDSCGGYDLTMYIPPRIKPKQYPNGYWGEVDSINYDYFDVEAWYPIPEEYHPEGYDHHD